MPEHMPARAEGAKKDHQEGSADPPCPSARFLVQVRAPGARAGPGGAVDDDDVFKRRIVSVPRAANPYLVERRTGGFFSAFGGSKAPRNAGKRREVSGALADVHAAQARIAGIQQELLAEEAQLSAPAGAGGGAPRAETMHPVPVSKEARALRAREAKKAQALAAEQARVRTQNGVKERKLAHERARMQAAETARQQSRGARALGQQLRHDRARSAARSSRGAAASAPRRAARSASAPRSRGARGRRQ